MTDNTRKRLFRVLTDLHHGGHAVSGETSLPVRDAALDAAAPSEATPLAEVAADATPSTLDQISTPFGYLFPDLAATYPAGHLPFEPSAAVVAALKALGSAMVDAPAEGDPNSCSARLHLLGTVRRPRCHREHRPDRSVSSRPIR